MAFILINDNNMNFVLKGLKSVTEARFTWISYVGYCMFVMGSNNGTKIVLTWIDASRNDEQEYVIIKFYEKCGLFTWSYYLNTLSLNLFDKKYYCTGAILC